MMLRASNGEFFDFNSDIEMERRVKLFEEIDQTLGDFSYTFDLEKTSNNIKILNYPLPDTKDKTIYQGIECDLLDNSGNTVYRGFLRVERINQVIECSFFSGNFNWFNLLVGSLLDIDFTDLDTELTTSNIANSWDNTEGIIFPVFDTGTLITRSFRSLMIEDFSGCIFVKTVFKRLFQSAGLKTTGELFEDPIFDTMLMSRLTIGPDDIKDRSTYAAKIVGNQSLSAIEKITFEDDFNYPYYDGASDNYSIVLNRYTADVKMRVVVDTDVILTIDAAVFEPRVEIRKNGVSFIVHGVENNIVARAYSFTDFIDLEAGDYLEVFGRQTIVIPVPGTAQPYSVLTGSTFKVTPTYLYFTSGRSLVPPWTKDQFVRNILNLFCVVSDYNPYTKTITFNFFNKIKDKEPIDLSDYITIDQVDFEEFISNFFQKSQLTYQESNDEDIQGYNNSKLVKYGAGEITVNNGLIEKTGTILNSEFKAPVSYINPAFSASFERTNYITLDELEQQDFTSVTDNLGHAQFNVADETLYTVGELVRIADSTNPVYNGDYVVDTVNTGYIILIGLEFSTDAIGNITNLRHKVDNDDGVYLFINTKYRVDNVSQYSRHSDFFVTAGPITNQRPNVAYGFFNLLNTGMPINDVYKQGLSFGLVDNQLSYQKSLIDKYWGQVARVLNDPVKLDCTGYIPSLVFSRLTPLRPIMIRTELTSNLYYNNQITGYKSSDSPCEVDIIKLS